MKTPQCSEATRSRFALSLVSTVHFTREPRSCCDSWGYGISHCFKQYRGTTVRFWTFSAVSIRFKLYSIFSKLEYKQQGDSETKWKHCLHTTALSGRYSEHFYKTSTQKLVHKNFKTFRSQHMCIRHNRLMFCNIDTNSFGSVLYVVIYWDLMIIL